MRRAPNAPPIRCDVSAVKVSVVTPSYNQGRFIERTLRSVACQEGVQIEHVVFDGGSTDETVDILSRHENGLRWTSEEDKGQTDAVNKGILATDGEIIGWLNSDDIYYPGAVAQVVAYFEAHPDVDVVYGLADHIDLDDKAFESYPSEPWNFERLKETCFICQPALFFRRRVVEQHGLLDMSLNYCMDYEYWLRLGRAGIRFGFIEQKLAGSRMYGENKTLGDRVKVHREINEMMRNTFGKVPDRWLFNYAHVAAENDIDRARSPRWFIIRLLVLSIGAALRWNGGISKEMRTTIVQFGRGLLSAER